MALEERDEERARERYSLLRRIGFFVGIAAILLATFAVGGLVYRIGKRPAPSTEESVPSTDPAQSARPSPSDLTDLRLVPASDLTSTVGRSITSAPPRPQAQGPTAGEDRADATALPSQQYARMEERAREAAAVEQADSPTVDPRTIRPEPPPPPPVRPTEPEPAPSASAEPPAGPADRPVTSPSRLPSPRPPPESEQRREVRRTRPEPISQPLPDINVTGTARFRLRIGPDGRVREVEVLQTIPGATASLVSSIQQWRFRPATENGRPIEGMHLVDVSFQARDD